MFLLFLNIVTLEKTLRQSQVRHGRRHQHIFLLSPPPSPSAPICVTSSLNYPHMEGRKGEKRSHDPTRPKPSRQTSHQLRKAIQSLLLNAERRRSLITFYFFVQNIRLELLVGPHCCSEGRELPSGRRRRWYVNEVVGGGRMGVG